MENHGFELITVPNGIMIEYFDTPSPLSELKGVTMFLKKRFSTPHVFGYDQAVGLTDIPIYSPRSYHMDPLVSQRRARRRQFHALQFGTASTRRGRSQPKCRLVVTQIIELVSIVICADATRQSGLRRMRKHLSEEEYNTFSTEKLRTRIVK